jgi:hypothetical protein
VSDTPEAGDQQTPDDYLIQWSNFAHLLPDAHARTIKLMSIENLFPSFQKLRGNYYWSANAVRDWVQRHKAPAQ